MNMKDLHLDSSLSFARKTALELVDNLMSLADAIQDDGDYQPVSSEVSAEAKYGDGWKYLLKVYYQKDFNCHWLELAVYHIPLPYKCTRLIVRGSKDEILEKLNDTSVVDVIERAIPDLHADLSDI